MSASVALLEAPLRFGRDAGAFTPFVAALPAGALPVAPRGVPGSPLDIAAAAAPAEFQLSRCLDLAGCLPDPVALTTQLRLLRRAMDELRLPARLFPDVVELLYRDNALARSTLEIDGRSVGPADLVASTLTVADPRSRAFPPQSILRFHEKGSDPRTSGLEA